MLMPITLYKEKVMSINNSSQRYSSLSIWMHWIVFLLMVAIYATIELREFFPKGSDPRNALKTWHFMLGISVFALVWIRLVAVAISRIPAIVPKPPHWQMLVAKATHGMLYLLMITMPILGWLLLSASGKPIPFFGIELPALIGESTAWAETLKEIHETGGSVGYFLIGLHATAGLFHHYVMRDNTLVRMLPKRD
jgi:cytochrome b561